MMVMPNVDDIVWLEDDCYVLIKDILCCEKELYFALQFQLKINLKNMYLYFIQEGYTVDRSGFMIINGLHSWVCPWNRFCKVRIDCSFIQKRRYQYMHPVILWPFILFIVALPMTDVNIHRVIAVGLCFVLKWSDCAFKYSIADNTHSFYQLASE